MYYSNRLKDKMRKTPMSAYWEKKFAEDRDRERERRRQQEQMAYPYKRI